MKHLKIEKFIDDKHEKTIQIPFFLFKIATKLFPKKAVTALAEQGIYFNEILAAQARNTPYSNTIYVTEKNIHKRIIISL